MPAWITPLLWPVWCCAIADSRSRTRTRSSGRRDNNSRVVARPRMPPPTTMVSQVSIALVNCGLGDAPAAVEEVEVAALGGLGHVLGEQLRVAARSRELSGHPHRTPLREFFFRNAQIEAPRRYVQRDLVA